MTVQTEINRVNHVGDSVQTVFPFTDILVLDESHMQVYLDDVIQPSGYTVDGIGDPAGGNVTFSVAPGTGVIVTLLRWVPLNQLIDYVPYDAFPAEVHEQGLDLASMGRIQLEERLDRSLSYPVSSEADAELPAPVALSTLGTDASADLVWYPGTPGGQQFVSVSSDNETTTGLIAAAVVQALPGSPDPRTLYFVTGAPVP